MLQGWTEYDAVTAQYTMRTTKLNTDGWQQDERPGSGFRAAIALGLFALAERIGPPARGAATRPVIGEAAA
jgi:hypothetical protein